MKLPKPKYYYDHTWRENYYFCIGWAEPDFIKYIKQQFGYTVTTDKANGKCIEWFHDNGASGYVIWTRFKSGKKLYPALAHECAHAALFSLTNRGVKLDANNSEPITYLIEALIKQAIG